MMSVPVSAFGFSVERVAGVAIAEEPALAETAPAVSMPSGVLRTTDGRTLWERDADDVRAMASITKVMTALVVLDKADPAAVVTISPAAAAVRESGIDLVAGQQLTVQQLLEAALIPSANDAAFALAEYVAGGEDAFVQLMNAKAAELGLTKTAFTNPHGLDEPGHHASANDVATLLSVAMADPRFAEIAGKQSVVLPSRGTMKRFETSNKLLGAYAGMLGGKTGWTNGAGFCLAASAHRDDIGLVAVVLGTGSEKERFAQTQALLDWGFQHYGLRQVASAEATAGLVPVSSYLDRTVPAIVESDAQVPVFDLDGEISSRLDLLGEVDAPVKAGQRLGTLTVVQGSRLLAQVPVVAAEDVEAPGAWDAFKIWTARVWRTAFGGQLQAAAVPMM